MFQIIGSFLLGIISWSLLEYVLHRFLGHWKTGTNQFTKEHLRHHRETDYFSAPRKKAFAAIMVLSITCIALSMLVGWFVGIPFSVGLGLMYLVYESVHKRAHTHAPIGQYGRWLRKHHFYHHFKNPKKNHGVTSPIWDIIFGTNVTTDIIYVPRKMPLQWLINPQSKEILPQFKSDYQYREGGTINIT